MNKKILFITAIIFSLIFVKGFSQETEAENTEIQNNEIEESKKKSFFNTTSLVLELTPGFYLNPKMGNETLIGQSASPIYPFSIGFIWPNNTFIAVAPTISFFMMNHLYYNGTAYPAEIENRTSQTFNFIVNIPLYFALNMKKATLQLAPGFAILPRFAILASGVPENDFGNTGTAQSDVNAINTWFWQNARFLYLSFSGCYLINLTKTVKGGPVIHAYLPLGTIFSGESIQGMIIAFGMKVQL